MFRAFLSGDQIDEICRHPAGQPERALCQSRALLARQGSRGSGAPGGVLEGCGPVFAGLLPGGAGSAGGTGGCRRGGDCPADAEHPVSALGTAHAGTGAGHRTAPGRLCPGLRRLCARCPLRAGADLADAVHLRALLAGADGGGVAFGRPPGHALPSTSSWPA